MIHSVQNDNGLLPELAPVPNMNRPNGLSAGTASDTNAAVATYLADIVEALGELEPMLNTGKCHALARTASILRINSSAFGVAAFADMWGQLATAADAGDLTHANIQIERIKAEYPLVKSMLQSIQDERTTKCGNKGFADEHAQKLILIAEDDEISREMLRTGLESQGYAVEEAQDGKQALELLNDLCPNLILLDAQMPLVDGFAVCEQLKTLPEETRVPVIMITGLLDRDSVQRAFEAGAVDYVTKPIHWPVLFKRIERLLLARQAEEVLKNIQTELERRVQRRTVELLIANERLRNEVIQREQVTEELQRSEEQLRRITDNMLDMICQTDATGIIQYATPSCHYVLGYAPTDLIGQSIYSRIHPDDVEQVIDAVHYTGKAEYRQQRADGTYIWLETLVCMLYQNGSIPGELLFASRDITEHKRAEQELQELNRLKTDFLSTAAHELRTPLVSIRGFAEILVNRQFDDVRRNRYLGLIHEQSVQVCGILDDLLDISRLEAKRRLTLTLETVDLSALVAPLQAVFSESSPKHVIQVSGFATCPPVTADKARISQVLKNLLSNAIKYSPQGGPITVRGEVLSGYVQISVQDRGIGMSPDQQTHLFEKFYRADASNTAIGGTGLGLAISKLIVELHGGQIGAHSEYGVGSTFFFTLPISG